MIRENSRMSTSLIPQAGTAAAHTKGAAASSALRRASASKPPDFDGPVTRASSSRHLNDNKLKM